MRIHLLGRTHHHGDAVAALLSGLILYKRFEHLGEKVALYVTRIEAHAADDHSIFGYIRQQEYHCQQIRRSVASFCCVARVGDAMRSFIYVLYFLLSLLATEPS